MPERATPPRWRPQRRLPYLLLLAALAAGIAVEALRPLPQPEPYLPILRAVPAHAVDEAETLYEAARELGPAAAPALLEVLRERSSPHSTIRSYAADDGGPDFLGDAADARLRARMVRLLADPGETDQIKYHIVVALCRPRHREAVPDLVRVACDRNQRLTVRHDILARLHRTKVAAPAELREVLYQRLGQVDLLAAAALARMGDAEAPSLVLEGLRTFTDDTSGLHLAAAADAIMGEPFAWERPKAHDFDERRKERREAMERRAARFEAWLDAHPEAFETAFEASRREYRRARAPRELSIQGFEEVLAAGDDFDLASASLLLTESDRREDVLNALDRLACFLRGKLDACRTPSQKIETLNHWLLIRHKNIPHSLAEGGELSFLPAVLLADVGNCVGYSTLYLAMAERLDLPLYGVTVPEHMFVRWDDGVRRRNIETTDGGSELPDAHYEGPALAAGDLLNLTKRQVLAVILSNRGAQLMSWAECREAREVFDQAAALWPDSPSVLRNRAEALFHSSLEDDERIAADLHRALALAPGDAGLRDHVAGRLYSIGSCKQALRCSATLDSETARAVRALCLLHEGRPEEALDLLEPSDVLPEAAVRAGLEPGNATAIAHRAALAGADAIELAAVLLARKPPHPAAALSLLEGLELGKYVLQAGDLKLPLHPAALDPMLAEPPRRKLALQAKALALLGRQEEAEAVLAKAEGLYEGGTSRALLEARALVRD